MKVIAVDDIAERTGSRFVGVFVAAKYARHLNEERNAHRDDPKILDPRTQEKMSTIALRMVTDGELEYRLKPKA